MGDLLIKYSCNPCLYKSKLGLLGANISPLEGHSLAFKLAASSLEVSGR